MLGWAMKLFLWGTSPGLVTTTADLLQHHEEAQLIAYDSGFEKEECHAQEPYPNFKKGRRHRRKDKNLKFGKS